MHLIIRLWILGYSDFEYAANRLDWSTINGLAAKF